ANGATPAGQLHAAVKGIGKHQMINQTGPGTYLERGQNAGPFGERKRARGASASGASGPNQVTPFVRGCGAVAVAVDAYDPGRMVAVVGHHAERARGHDAAFRSHHAFGAKRHGPSAGALAMLDHAVGAVEGAD